MKGPWTHFPMKNHLGDLLKKIRMVKDLVEKVGCLYINNERRDHAILKKLVDVRSLFEGLQVCHYSLFPPLQFDNGDIFFLGLFIARFSLQLSCNFSSCLWQYPLG